jgi:hypothetical protein
MGGYAQVLDGFIVGMGMGIEPVDEQIDDTRAAELSRRQADVVDDQQGDGPVFRTIVEIRRRDANGSGEPALLVNIRGAQGSSPAGPASVRSAAWRRASAESGLCNWA